MRGSGPPPARAPIGRPENSRGVPKTCQTRMPAMPAARPSKQRGRDRVDVGEVGGEGGLFEWAWAGGEAEDTGKIFAAEGLGELLTVQTVQPLNVVRGGGPSRAWPVVVPAQARAAARGPQTFVRLLMRAAATVLGQRLVQRDLDAEVLQ